MECLALNPPISCRCCYSQLFLSNFYPFNKFVKLFFIINLETITVLPRTNFYRNGKFWSQKFFCIFWFSLDINVQIFFPEINTNPVKTIVIWSKTNKASSWWITVFYSFCICLILISVFIYLPLTGWINTCFNGVYSLLVADFDFSFSTDEWGYIKLYSVPWSILSSNSKPKNWQIPVKTSTGLFTKSLKWTS